MLRFFEFLRRPTLALALAATLGVVLQMHPVVFGGRSMVSPDNGPVLLLYERFPTLPSYTKAQNDDAMGADVGALMWAHMPYAAVQHKAIFEHGEWPLWDRYNLGGLPLLGQGQSMFGNPLHALVIATDNAAWAWDVEFVLARWLFAFGLGVAAFLLGAGLAGSLVLAFSAAFIGFFAYRYNHPAIFSLSYAPLILVAWAGIVRARHPRGLAAWLGLLMLASLLELTSGTAKEAVILMVSMHGVGGLILWGSGQPRRMRLRKLLAASAAGLVFVLLTAPHWWVFLAVLKQSFTSYDLPGVAQNPPWQLIGLFDDMFFRELRPGGRHSMPATNFLVLLGVGWSLLRFRALPTRGPWIAVTIGAGATMALAYGLVPGGLLVRIPWLANIHHIDSTFSCPLVILALLLAAFGWHQLMRDLGQRTFAVAQGVFTVVLAALLALYFAFMDRPTTPFFTAYAGTLVFAVVVLPGAAAWLAWLGRRRLAHASLLVCAALCLWRHGQYRPHGLFDEYLVNPGQRVDLRGESRAIDLIKQSASQPFRVLGLGWNLAPGYGAMFGLETIYGVDALRSPRYYELLLAYDFRRGWSWDRPDPVSSVPGQARLRDSLGVRYYLASPSSWRRLPVGVRLLARLDLDVFERPEAWPRAYFTDAAILQSGAAAVAGLINSGDGRPLAVMDPGDWRLVPGVKVVEQGTAPRTVDPAFDYRLSENDTTFKVNATGPGVIVLCETYYADAFQVRLDGRAVPYFPVNHAFKGIYVEHAGEHTVSFRYRGQHFGLSMRLAQVGLALLLALALALLLPRRSWLQAS